MTHYKIIGKVTTGSPRIFCCSLYSKIIHLWISSSIKVHPKTSVPNFKVIGTYHSSVLFLCFRKKSSAKQKCSAFKKYSGDSVLFPEIIITLDRIQNCWLIQSWSWSSNVLGFQPCETPLSISFELEGSDRYCHLVVLYIHQNHV